MQFAIAALISSMLMGYEILWLKFFGSHMGQGPTPLILPVIFFGGSLGAAIFAAKPSGRAWFAKNAVAIAAAGDSPQVSLFDSEKRDFHKEMRSR